MFYKIYAEMPNGEKRIMEIEESGGFYDPSKVIHDERTQGAMPEEYLNEFNELLINIELNQTEKYQTELATHNSARQALLDLGLSEEQVNSLSKAPPKNPLDN